MTFEERSEEMREWVLPIFGRKAQQTEGRISAESPTDLCPIQQQHDGRSGWDRLSKGTMAGDKLRKGMGYE